MKCSHIIHTFDALPSRIEREFSKGTAERYRTSSKHTVEFLQWKYKINDIDIRKVNYAFIMEYDFYLRSVRKCANNSAVKYLKNFRKIIRICLSNGWLMVNPFAHYKSKIKKVERVYLTEQEIENMANKGLTSERLEQLRDVFLFCCFTGLAYIDVKNLRSCNVVTGVDGDKWISIERQKTNTPSRIPLLPTAPALLNQHQENRICLNDFSKAQQMAQGQTRAKIYIIEGVNHVYDASRPYTSNRLPNHLQQAGKKTLDFILQ